MTAPRVFFYVQYLEGIGHVVRATRIVEDLLRRGASVTLVLGGEPVPGVMLPSCRIVQLPPVRATPESYSRLLRPDGERVDATYEAERRAALLAAYDADPPDVLITEGYPLGRWAMEFELGPLLEHAAAHQAGRPVVVASLRDILQVPKDPAKVDRSMAILARHYDALLVHGDPRLVAVEASFPAIAPFLDRVHYTGLVAPPPPPEPAGLAGNAAGIDVVVSAGGGAIAEAVLTAAIQSKPLTDLASGRWLALTGPRMPEAAFAYLGRLATEAGVTLERFRPDLVGVMRGATLSIQRAGYNTVADLLVAGCRAVLVPDSDHRQREQPLRAERLQALGRAVVLEEADLSADRMAAAIAKAFSQDVAAIALNLDGAATTARRILALSSAAEASKRRSERIGRRLD